MNANLHRHTAPEDFHFSLSHPPIKTKPIAQTFLLQNEG